MRITKRSLPKRKELREFHRRLRRNQEAFDALYPPRLSPMDHLMLYILRAKTAYSSQMMSVVSDGRTRKRLLKALIRNGLLTKVKMRRNRMEWRYHIPHQVLGNVRDAFRKNGVPV